MPKKPRTASIIELAQELGADTAQAGKLSPHVRKLTKGDLIELWGASDEAEALKAYQEGRNEQITAHAARLHLDLKDISTIQSLFPPRRVMEKVGVAGDEDTSRFDLYCCCCPCCCAEASIEPIRFL